MKHLVSTAAIVLGLIAAANPVLAEEPKPPATPKEEIAAAQKAVEKLGGRLDRYPVESTQTWGGADSRYAKAQIDAIMFDNATDTTLKDLPVIAYPFHLGVSGDKITDAGMKELARQKNLTQLALRS